MMQIFVKNVKMEHIAFLLRNYASHAMKQKQILNAIKINYLCHKAIGEVLNFQKTLSYALIHR